MPRSNRPRGKRGSRRPITRPGPARGMGPATEEVEFAGQLWTVRRVRGNDSGRSYRCPGCQQEVSAAVPHTVTWPSTAMHGMENRRHWHTPCWSARESRPPGGSWA